MRLVHRISYVLTGRILYSAAQWFLLIFITRHYGLLDAGSYTYSIALVGPWVLLSQMNMRIHYATSRDDNAVSLHSYQKARLLATVLMILVVGLIEWLTGSEDGIYKILIPVILYKAVESVCELRYGAYLKEGREIYVGLSDSLKGISVFLAIAASMLLGLTVTYMLVVVMVLWLLVGLNDIRKTSKHSNKNASARGFVDLAKECFPYGVILFVTGINFNIHTYVLKWMGSLEDVGVFASVAYLLLIGKIIVTSAGQVIAPALSKLSDGNQYKLFLRKSILIVFSVSLMICILGSLFSKEILVTIYGQEFESNGKLLGLVLLAACLNYTAQVANISLTIRRQKKTMLAVQLMSLLIGAVASVIAVQQLGYLGAGIGLVVGMGVNCCMALVAAWRKEHDLFDTAVRA